MADLAVELGFSALELSAGDLEERSPQEFGSICAFLCSMHAAYITGQNVLADGGAYPGTY